MCGDDFNDKTRNKFLGLGIISILRPDNFGLCDNVHRLPNWWFIHGLIKGIFGESLMEMGSKNQRLPARQEKRSINVDSSSAQVPVVDSDRLFGGRNEVIVRHGELLYRLRITRNGKLVMNK